MASLDEFLLINVKQKAICEIIHLKELLQLLQLLTFTFHVM